MEKASTKGTCRIFSADSTIRVAGILPNFTKLRILRVSDPLVKWDLDIFGRLPLLEELYCNYVNLAGSLSNLRVLKDTLEKLYIVQCVKSKVTLWTSPPFRV